jgi:cyclopropane fatty-acyl-phospholipid synthase-like methyltransferase
MLLEIKSRNEFMTPQDSTWNNVYSADKKLWGEKPSELALFAHTYLKESRQFGTNRDIFILDMGCGYARDAVFLAQNLSCHILGLDNSEKAIEMARESLSAGLEKRIELLNYDFSHVSDKYDVILASNLYQVLKPDERSKLRETVRRCLKSGGLFFLSTLSVHDPQHSGGIPIENEMNSVYDRRYLHLSTRAELEADFDFLNISVLFEREYHEQRAADSHHHISWIMMGSLKN